MIVVDASALLAILLDEPEKDRFVACILANPCLVSPVGYWEAAIRVRRLHGDGGIQRLDRLMKSLSIDIAPATAVTAHLASRAERDFGKATTAKLNLGDCFAYALTIERNASLLFKGNDFGRTDIRSALTD